MAAGKPAQATDHDVKEHTMSTVARQLNTSELEQRVKRMYAEVALEPEREFHFETGRPLAERLGYAPSDLDRIPGQAIDSFAGVGHFLDLAAIAPGETVLDLGSGSRRAGRNGGWQPNRPSGIEPLDIKERSR